MVFLPESAQLAAEMWQRELGIDTEVVVGEEVCRKTGEPTRRATWMARSIWRDNETRVDATQHHRVTTYGRRDYRDTLPQQGP